MEDWFQQAQFIASLATAAGVIVAAFQLREQRKQQTAAFEDRLNEEYRRLIGELPLRALLNGSEASVEDLDDATLQVFYRYFDLCNEQLFLHIEKKVSKNTWENWRDGIKQNMDRPQFLSAWKRIARDCPGFFEKLRVLVPPAALPDGAKGYGTAADAGGAKECAADSVPSDVLVME